MVDGRWRRVAAAAGALALVAIAVGAILNTGLTGSSPAASPPKASSGSATVQRRTLIATDTESGTLSYANQRTVFNRLTGTITSLPAVGALIKPGQALYDVDGAPVVLFNGNVPAYRTLQDGVTDGADVQELKQNLVTLGFDPSHQVTINQTFDAATTAAVDAWQASLGETQTGIVTLGEVVFLPGPQRITAVDGVLGGTGGSASGTGSGTGASLTLTGSQTEFVSWKTAPAGDTTTTTTTTPPPCNGVGTVAPAGQTTTVATQSTAPNCQSKNASGTTSSTDTTRKGGMPNPTTLLEKALTALLKAETQELKVSSRSGAASSSGATSAASSRSGGGGGSGASSAGAASSAGGSASSGSSGSSGSSAAAASASPILATTSTQVIVSVQLDATKQSEAFVGETVTVQLPNGNTVGGTITQVSPVAQSSSSSSSSGTGGGAGASSSPSATIPITIALKGHEPGTGLDQAAVSVNFEQQVARNVLSVPVTALIATAGGGYAVQEATPPHQLIPVTPGLFAAGYVQISGSQIYPGLQVTDSQG